MKKVSGVLECVFKSDDGKEFASTLEIKDFDLNSPSPYPSWATPEQWAIAMKTLADIVVKDLREQHT